MGARVRRARLKHAQDDARFRCVPQQPASLLSQTLSHQHLAGLRTSPPPNTAGGGPGGGVLSYKFPTLWLFSAVSCAPHFTCEVRCRKLSVARAGAGAAPSPATSSGSSGSCCSRRHRRGLRPLATAPILKHFCFLANSPACVGAVGRIPRLGLHDGPTVVAFAAAPGLRGALRVVLASLRRGWGGGRIFHFPIRACQAS
jgi:hypothetical protein